MRELETDILIVGGGVGGVAAALAACAAGLRVTVVEPYRWIGGQLTSQAVPPDEHPWIETHGSSRRYRAFRTAVRDFYRDFYPLKTAPGVDPLLNPGGGWVSPLCHEPRVAHHVLQAMLAPFRTSGRLTIHTNTVPTAAETDGDRVLAVKVRRLDGTAMTLTAKLFLDASDLGDLLHLARIEYRTGVERQADTGEPSAPSEAAPDDMQAITVVFAIDQVDGTHIIDRPLDYAHWRDAQPPGWPGKLLGWSYPNPRTLLPVTPRFQPNADGAHESHEIALLAPELWSYRRILARDNHRDGFFASDVTLVNWPMNDYLEGGIVDVTDADHHVARARALSMSLLYWLQTEAPRSDGGAGYPGLRLRPDIVGTSDGLAQAPYVREGRRIVAVSTVTEQDLAVSVRGSAGAVRYRDSVGTGAYRIDLHPTAAGRNYLDVAAHPFEIPLGALIPQRVENVIAAGKTIGTTHITNGCYRVHPAEWSIGEAAGSLAAFCVARGASPHAVRSDEFLLDEFQCLLSGQGSDLHWNGGERLPG